MPYEVGFSRFLYILLLAVDFAKLYQKQGLGGDVRSSTNVRKSLLRIGGELNANIRPQAQALETGQPSNIQYHIIQLGSM